MRAGKFLIQCYELGIALLRKPKITGVISRESGLLGQKEDVGMIHAEQFDIHLAK